MHEQRRLSGPLMACYADSRHRLSRALCEMQEHFWLHRVRQSLTIGRHADVVAAVGGLSLNVSLNCPSMKTSRRASTDSAR
ncbi:hypothetical protein DMB90_06905 [Raoultella planticola]|uniref:Uncharacterized protein n=1 Tax=Raoultella planticola TaxID=575 RepID=A0A5P6A9F9_RAOPL|nr:hypothetical protein DMB90_06905 [Raoultella planticola]